VCHGDAVKSGDHVMQLVMAVADALSVYYNYTGKTTCYTIGSEDDNLDSSGWNYQASTLTLERTTPFFLSLWQVLGLPTTWSLDPAQVDKVEALAACGLLW